MNATAALTGFIWGGIAFFLLIGVLVLIDKRWKLDLLEDKSEHEVRGGSREHI